MMTVSALLAIVLYVAIVLVLFFVACYVVDMVLPQPSEINKLLKIVAGLFVLLHLLQKYGFV